MRAPSPHLTVTVEAVTAAEIAIARSVLFSALFDYPLTMAQLRQTLIECELTPSEIAATYAGGGRLREIVEYRDGFFFPAGRPDLIAERRSREARSRAFLEDNRRLLAVICAMPFVRMVALSGSIAHLNLEGGGDLDLFVITRAGRVWSVTVAIVLLSKVMRRRHLVCANFVLSESALPLEQQDLFAASQIIHLKPLTGWRLFASFVRANPFVNRFYPNFHPSAGTTRRPLRSLARDAARRVLEWALTPAAAIAEPLCRFAYGRHLRRRAASWRSPDQVRMERDCLKLHTRSHRGSVLDRFHRIVDEAVLHPR